MKTEKIKVIKPCCDSMKCAMSTNTIYIECDEPCIDTGIYEDNPIPINNCPYCGTLIEIYDYIAIADEEEEEKEPPFLTAYDKAIIAMINEPPIFGGKKWIFKNN